MNQQTLFAPANADVGYKCGCCGSFIKRYRRKMNSNIAVTLIALYMSGENGFVHIEDFLRQKGYKRSGDFAKATLWGLLEKMEGEREDGSSRNGYYRLTGRGILFVEGKLTVKSTAVILNGRFENFEGEDITIKDALGTKFNYSELMGL